MAIAAHHCAQTSSRTLHTFSGKADTIESCKESLLITQLTQHHNLQPHLYSPGDLTTLAEQVFALWLKLGEPFDAGMVLQFLLYSQAATTGCPVVMDGVDGDLAFSLFDSYPSVLFRQLQFHDAIRETWQQNHTLQAGYAATFRRLGLMGLSAFAPRWLRQLKSRVALHRSMQAVMRESPIRPEFALRTSLKKRLQQFASLATGEPQHFPQCDFLRRIQHNYLPVALERYDRVAARCSVEPRHPLLDKRLIDFYSGLPWDQFVRNGWSKFLFRRVAEQYLPQNVCWRTGKEHVGYQFTKTLMDQKKRHYI